MAVSFIQPSFAGGEIGVSPGRIDMAKYSVALRVCDNFIMRQYGGVENRPGTKFVTGKIWITSTLISLPVLNGTDLCAGFGLLRARVIKAGMMVFDVGT